MVSNTHPLIRSSVRCTLRKTASQDLGQNHGVVVLGVASRIDEGQRAPSRPAPKFRDPCALVAKLVLVAPAELLEAAGLVAEIPPELGAWRQLTVPLVKVGMLAGYPTGPQPVDQYAVAI